MNDTSLVKMAVLIVIVYSVYMFCHVIQGTLAPDGIYLSAVIGAVCLLAGKKYESERLAAIAPSVLYPEECRE